MKRSYHAYLEGKFLERAARESGFRDPNTLENFIMDFEVYNIVRSRLDVCLRGGMAVPFYLDRGTMRLSRDIDMLVFEQKDAARAKMHNLQLRQDDYGIKIAELQTHQNLKHLPLAQYKIHYRSASGSTNAIKLDLLCDPQIKTVPCKVVGHGFGLRCFSTQHEVRLLDHGALVADKITSLSEPPVGYGEEQRNQMHKQIYDIALLLKSRPRADLGRLAKAYDLLASAKGSYARRGETDGPSPVEIMAGVSQSVLGLLNHERAFSLTQEFSNGFSAFKSTYIGGLPYRRTDHHADTLLVALFAARLLRLIKSGADAGPIGKSHLQTIEILRKLGRPSTRPTAEQAVKDSINADDSSPDRYASMLPDVAYLVHKIRLEEHS